MRIREGEAFWIGDRYFTAEDLGHIQATVRRFSRLTRNELAATLCENLPWKAANGRLKVDACRLLLLRMQAAGLIRLPALAGQGPKQFAEAVAPPLAVRALRAALAAVRPATVEAVAAAELRTFNATLAAYHYLGYRRPIGAHQRYWIRVQDAGEPRIVGAMLFGAAAKAVAARDEWIGWSGGERSRYRWRIVNQSRFLILPGIEIPHLASHVLSLAARQVLKDWPVRYGYAPVLLETFVEPPWQGTSYLAANWIRLGETAGRGRQDRKNEYALSRKTIFVYPLRRDWRKELCRPLPVPDDEADA